MQTELYYQTFEQSIVRNNDELGFEMFRAKSMKQAEDTSQKDKPPSTIHRLSTMMSNWLLEGGREPMKQKEGSTMKKLSQNTLQLGDKLK